MQYHTYIRITYVEYPLIAHSKPTCMLEVQSTSTLGRRLRASSEVSTALTTRTASPGSLLDMDEERLEEILSTSSAAIQ